MSADIPDPQVVTVHGTSIRIPQGFATMSSSSYERVFIRDRGYL